jgi:hypothetical protein
MKKFNFFLDEKTSINLEKQAKKYKTTKSKFLRSLINKRTGNKQLKTLERVAVHNAKVLLDLSRVPNNLNQIAYELHIQKHKFDEDKLYYMIEDLIQDIKIHSSEINRLNKALLGLY